MTQEFHGRQYSGDLYLRKWGTSDAFVKLGNVNELKTSQKVKTDTLKSTGREDFGQAIDSISTPEPAEVSIGFDSFDKHSFACMLMGEAVDLTGVVKPFIDEAHVVKAGMIKLSLGDIDPVTFVLKDSSGDTVDPSMYVLNPRLGMVRFTEHSLLMNGEAFTVTGTTLGTAGYVIDANTLQNLPMEMYLDGKDRITGKDGVLEIGHAVLSADGDIDWFADKWWKGGLKGTLVKDKGKPTMRFKEFN